MFVAETFPFVLSRENWVSTPSVDADERQVLVLKGWKFLAAALPFIFSTENGA